MPFLPCELTIGASAAGQGSPGFEITKLGEFKRQIMHFLTFELALESPNLVSSNVR